jgi:UDP-glucose:(heptosyl)LPS alpha-1,3-glucosyltransferase
MLGIRQDIPAIMAAADVLVHPARIETTGTVIIEALANGLPVVTTDTCGFAPFVETADAGVVITGSCSYRQLVEAIAKARAPDQLEVWSSCAEAFGRDPSLSLGHAEAARLFVGELW